ncbi:MAG: ABC transporter permease [Chitinophagaceae bacterium]|uniref:ABC transporter permease n=1 Tax=unclassified Paraflavitalea TaxID=2798305 RepID=UPI003D35722F|nr:ABC transporter permease [Chitinophagaceae bacterium]
MRTLSFLLQKEFRQILRNKIMLRLIIIMPIVQLIVMPMAANYEIKNIYLSIVDQDRSAISANLMKTILSSGYFKLSTYRTTYEEAYQDLEADKADLVLNIPPQFERSLYRENKQSLFIAVNAINGSKATVGANYLNSIIQEFNKEIRQKQYDAQPIKPVQLEITNSNWFNPHLNYKLFMVPGILVVLVTMLALYMCSLNIVREKEIGTIEQINVTPITKVHFVLGKLIPFWVLGMFVFSFGLLVVSRVVYGIVPAGSFLLLYAYLALFLVAMLGLGLLISTYAATQQQAMSLAFFLMMIFLLLSGLFTSVESMPQWAQIFAHLNPVTYFIEVVRMVILKGSGWADVKLHLLATAGFAVLFNTWAILNYKKQA